MCENETNTNTKFKIMQSNNYPGDQFAVGIDGNQPNWSDKATKKVEPILAKNEPVSGAGYHSIIKEVAFILTFFEDTTFRI